MPTAEENERCPYCRKEFKIGSLGRHIANKRSCREAEEAQIAMDIDDPGLHGSPPPLVAIGDLDIQAAPDVDYDFDVVADEPEDPPVIPPFVPQREPQGEPTRVRRRVHMEEVDEDEVLPHHRYVEEYEEATKILYTGETEFEKAENALKESGGSPYAPFADSDEWGLASWLMKNTGQTKTNQFLDLPIVSTTSLEKFHNTNRAWPCRSKIDSVSPSITTTLSSRESTAYLLVHSGSAKW